MNEYSIIRLVNPLNCFQNSDVLAHFAITKQGMKFKTFSTIQFDTRNAKSDISHENLVSHIYMYSNVQTLN